MADYLLMNVVSLITAILLLAAMGYYFWDFYRLKKKAKKINWFFIGGIIGSLILAFVLSIVGLSLAATNRENQPIAALVVWIMALIIIIGAILLLFFCLQYFAIGLTDQAISFLGEKILYSNIKAIIKDEKTKKIFILYSQGKRVIKKIVISPKLISADFFAQSITGHKVESKDAQAYYNQLMKSK